MDGKLSRKKIVALTALLVVAVSNPVAGTAGGVITANYLAAQGAVSAAESGAVIALIAVLGIVTIIAIFNDYDVEIEVNPLRIILTKK